MTDDEKWAVVSSFLDVIKEQKEVFNALTAVLMSCTGLPEELHLTAIKKSLPSLSAKLKNAVIAEIGENPWLY